MFWECKKKNITIPEIETQIDFKEIINKSYSPSKEEENNSQSQIEDFLPDEIES